jgi:hypothetical protein
MIKYREYFKELLKEDPDNIRVDDVQYPWDAGGVRATFSIYEDIISGKEEYIGIRYNNSSKVADYKIVASNESVKIWFDYWYHNFNKPINVKNSTIISFIDFWIKKGVDRAEAIRILNNLKRDLSMRGNSIHTHYDIMSMLRNLGFAHPSTGAIVSGRLFILGDGNYFSFWEEYEEVEEYAPEITKFLTELGIDYRSVKYQMLGMGDNEFIEYNDLIKAEGGGIRDISDEEKQKTQIAKDLHIQKGQLDKTILDVIATKPENAGELYKALEIQFKMPVVKIKNIFNRHGIPLDQVLAKNLMEVIRNKKKKSVISKF